MGIADEATRDALVKDEAVRSILDRIDATNGLPVSGRAHFKNFVDWDAQNKTKQEGVKYDDGKARADSTPLGACLDEAKSTICGDRQDAYGSPEDSFKIIAGYWSTYLGREISPLDVAHLMTLFKVARMQGQRPHRDNYVDACGYLGIAADRLLEAPK